MKKTTLLSSFFLLSIAMLHGQKSPGKIISPVAGSTIPNESLFIVFQKNKELRWEDYNLQVKVDNVNLNALVKLSGELLTVLAPHRMKPGEHSIMVHFAAKGKEPLEVRWAFFVAGRKNPLPASAKKPGFSMRSSLQLQSRFTDLSGPGQSLRQEPPSLHTVNFLGSAFHNDIEIPFRFYVSNQERSSLQWRNTYMVGLKTKQYGLFVGDVFPKYQRHLLDGSKIRGGRAYVKLRNTTLDISYGNIQRSLEGELRQYNVALGFPPVNLEASTGLYVVPGNYSRYVLATQVRFNGKGTKNETTLSFLRGIDRASSIKYGGPPGQNLVLGFGQKAVSKNNVLDVDFGASISITTRDTRLGAASSQDIEDIYGREPPADPASVEHFFLLNASTTPYRITGLPSASAFANMRLKLLQQHFSLQFEQVGSAFYSYGMPFLINDRRTIAASDWVHLWEKRVMLSANYRYYVNNLSEEKPITQNTGYLQASLRFSPKPNWPQLLLSLNNFDREGEDVHSKSMVLKRTILTYTAGLQHAFQVGTSQQSFNLSFSRNTRTDDLRSSSDFFTNSLNVQLTSNLPASLQLTLEYQFLLLSNDTSDFNRQSGYGFRLRYQTTNKKFNLSAGARQFHTAETFFTPEASRRLFDGRAEFSVLKDLSFSLQFGLSKYEEAMGDFRNYEELWGELGLRYRLQ